MNNNRVYTVSELNESIRRLLENRFSQLCVAGEISNLRRPYSGHLYFTLKDDQGQLKAVLFKMQQRYLQQQPIDGQFVVCRGRLSVYEPRGDYQLIVDHIDFHGTGTLQIAFEQLKTKLSLEGLFDQQFKKKLPPFPDHITLLTSPQGAAVHDFIRIASRRFSQVQLAVYPVPVQGGEAAQAITEALKRINQEMDTDIIVLCRGGGSIEDLQPFNDERLARAIFASSKPVVSAIGHEIDFTIADFISDLRAPTPSGAAELLLPDAQFLQKKITALQEKITSLLQWTLERAQDRIRLQQQKLGDFSTPLTNLFLHVDQQSMHLIHSMKNRIGSHQQLINTLQLRLERQNPDVRLQISSKHLVSLQQRLFRAGKQAIASKAQHLMQQKELLEAVGPHATLARGYAIVRKKQNRKVITDSLEISPGEQAEVLLRHGQIDVTVDSCCLQSKTPRDE